MSLLVTILCGGRPALLERTVATLERAMPALVQDARVVAFVNGIDEASTKCLRARSWVDEILEGRTRLHIGPAISNLMAVSQPERARYLLHLEDDWECAASGWYEPAVAILEREHEVGQVRLRIKRGASFVGHAVSRYHMVTRQPLRWEARGRGLYEVAKAHYTFNPTLVRTAVAKSVFPCTSEIDAARRFLGTGLGVAQLLPGAFRHIGGKDSLRAKTGST